MTLQDIFTDIENLGSLEGVDVSVLARTDFDIPIYLVHVGPYDGVQIIVEGSIHAREYITSLLLIEQIKYLHDEPLDFGIYFVPLVNPDGVRLVLEGADWLPEETRQFLLMVNGGSADFSQWKANANAVDPNVNFDALWGGGSQNVTYPSPANYIGPSPNSEKEVQALIDLTNKVQPVLTLSYHTKGQVIYYGFEVLTPEQIARDAQIANEIAAVTGYVPIKTEASTGGYPDWVSLNFGVPAYTIEVGSPALAHPIGLQHLPGIFEKNKNVPIVAFNALKAYNEQNS